MPAVVFREMLPEISLLAGLKKFPNALSITCHGSAPAEVPTECVGSRLHPIVFEMYCHETGRILRF